MEKEKNKQIPFRYPKETEQDFEELFKLQYWTKKKNPALIHALRIASGYIKKITAKDKDLKNYELKETIQRDLKIKLPW